MINLFIDSSIYLTFYHFSNDDLEQLKKLSVAVNKKIKLYLPQQVVQEYRRNREVKIADALKKFNEQKLPSQFPQLCKDYDEYTTLSELVDTYEKKRNELLEKLVADIKSNSLKADALIRELFRKAEFIPTSDELLASAKTRYDIGNPPGKNKSYGDAVNWESLLKTVNNKEELHVIAKDKDYVSVIDNENISEFLSNEWERRKQSNVYYYSNLSVFFAAHFPDIKLASEFARKMAINDLAISGSFASTHSAIAKLSNLQDFSPDEACQLADILLINDQVSLIGTDPDVVEFVDWLIKSYHKYMPPNIIQDLRQIYYDEEDVGFLPEDGTVPF